MSALMRATSLRWLAAQRLMPGVHHCALSPPLFHRAMATAASAVGAAAAPIQLKIGVAVTLLRPSTLGSGYDALLIQRGKAPMAGHWAFPGGSLEPGETLQHGAQREMLEETSIRVTAVEPFYVTEILLGQGERGTQYVLVHMLAEPVSASVGEAVRAADDALEARWMAVEAVRRMEAAMSERGSKTPVNSAEDTLIVPHVGDVLDRAILLYERLFAKR